MLLSLNLRYLGANLKRVTNRKQFDSQFCIGVLFENVQVY